MEASNRWLSEYKTKDIKNQRSDRLESLFKNISELVQRYSTNSIVKTITFSLDILFSDIN